MSVPTLLTSLLAGPESDALEFKVRPEPQSVAEVVTAFLNTRGGVIVIGVSEAGDLLGVEAAGRRREEIETFLLNQIAPKAALRIEVVEEGGREAIVVEVPPGAQKPYVFGGSIYVRNGAQTVLASVSDVTRLIDKRARDEERWERLAAVGMEAEVLDATEIERTLAAAARRYTLPVEPGANAAAKLERLDLAVDGWPRNAAIVLFLSRGDRGRYPQLAVRASVFTDDQRLATEEDRHWEGNAFYLFQRLFEFVGQHTSVRSRVGPEDPVRQDKPALPALVAREAILNALTHREYRDIAPVQLRLFPGHLELWNPGGIPEELIVQPGASRPRNPDIARVLYLRGYIEMLGVGMLRMRDEMLTAGLPAPLWENRSGGTQLTLYLATDVPGKGMPDAERRALGERAYTYLQDAKPGERITREEYQSRYAVGMAERSARNDLKRLNELGYVRPVGASSSTAYIRTEKAAS